MDPLVVEKAKWMMRQPILSGNRYLPSVYVVGKRCFAFKRVAEDWQREVNQKAPVEVVSILDVFGIHSPSEMPKGIKVAWSINKQIEESLKDIIGDKKFVNDYTKSAIVNEIKTFSFKIFFTNRNCSVFNKLGVPPPIKIEVHKSNLFILLLISFSTAYKYSSGI